jgi:hypothetical protein
MLAAATYLAGALEPWVALIVFVTIGSYIPLTIIVTEWRGNFRRDMNKTGGAGWPGWSCCACLRTHTHACTTHGQWLCDFCCACWTRFVWRQTVGGGDCQQPGWQCHTMLTETRACCRLLLLLAMPLLQQNMRVVCLWLMHYSTASQCSACY